MSLAVTGINAAHKSIAGFAMLSAVWVVAILSMISIATLRSYLSNTQATQFEVNSLQVDFLLDAGLKFAALSIASPRAGVVASAVPQKILRYSSDVGDVTIQISNEAGRIDLSSADPVLLENLFKVLNYPIEKAELEALAKGSYRSLRETYANAPHLLNIFADYTTLHNGQRGVNPLLATEEVLEAVPTLSNAQRQRLLRERNQTMQSIISSPIENNYLGSHISAHYRITTMTSTGQQSQSRTQIIKMLSQGPKLFEVVATL